MKPDLLKSIERLEPASFTIVMSTGAFAIATRDLGAFYDFFIVPSQIINFVNFFLFVSLVIFAGLTWPFHGRDFRHDLDLPQQSAFYAAIGISFLVLSAQALRFEMGFWPAFALWAPGSFLTLSISFAINYNFFLKAVTDLKLFTPVFFIPVGGLMVLPVSGINLMNQVEGIFHDILFMINSLSLGSGFLLYIGLFSFLLQRHYLAEHLPANLMPTIWIHLAPIGWGGVSLVSFAQHVGETPAFSRIIGSMLWGGCCWWVIMCILLTIRAILSCHMKFSLAYWAFIFPLSSITILSFKLNGPFLPAFYILWCGVAAIWCLAFYKTIKSFFIFLLHCLKA